MSLELNEKDRIMSPITIKNTVKTDSRLTDITRVNGFPQN